MKFLRLISVITLLSVVMCFCSCGTEEKSTVSSEQKSTVSDVASLPEVKPEPITVTIGNTGDILMHDPILDAYNFDGKYDFTEMFKYSKEYYEKYDYMTANLELTLAGKERVYSGYPCFNCPDSILDALYDSGVDMVTASNNHCFDFGESGFLRTVDTLTNHKIEFTGTRKSTADKPYIVKDIKGIKVGMINYTYETPSQGGKKAINAIPVTDAASPLINSFDYDNLDAFYTEIQQNINAMYTDGAEAIIAYMHWGNEYFLTENNWQRDIAQKLCDFGVDVIVGGHPHVIEPVDIFSSDISGKQTVCLFSLGNEISNQRKERMEDEPTGHTEDGMIFEITLQKNPDGEVFLKKTDIIPTWVNMYDGADGRRKYEAVPLDKSKNYADFGVTDTYSADASYDRTMEIVGKGLKKANAEYRQKDIRPTY